MAASDSPAFRLGFVPGATPAKWARVWQARHPGTELQLVPVGAADAEGLVVAGDLDAALLRPPVDREVLHTIVLYAEEPVVVVSRDHLLAALDDDDVVALADLADEIVLQPADDVLAWAGHPGADAAAAPVPGSPPRETPPTTADAIALVAAGVGVLVVPRSLARLHQRKDVVVRTLTDAPVAPVALAWPIDRADDRHEDLIGIVRGRTINSSRGRLGQAADERRTDGAEPGRAARSGRRASDRRRQRPPSRRGRRR